MNDQYHDHTVEVMSKAPLDVPLSKVFGHESDEALRLHLAEQRIATLEAALTEAHRVILHEIDSGRTPYMLKAENGGKGLGYFEDVLSGISHP